MTKLHWHEIFKRNNKFKYQVEKERWLVDYENSF